MSAGSVLGDVDTIVFLCTQVYRMALRTDVPPNRQDLEQHKSKVLQICDKVGLSVAKFKPDLMGFLDCDTTEFPRVIAEMYNVLYDNGMSKDVIACVNELAKIPAGIKEMMDSGEIQRSDWTPQFYLWGNLLKNMETVNRKIDSIKEITKEVVARHYEEILARRAALPVVTVGLEGLEGLTIADYSYGTAGRGRGGGRGGGDGGGNGGGGGQLGLFGGLWCCGGR